MVNLALLAAGWLVGWWLLWRVPRLATPRGVLPDGSDLTVVIPARDEQASLPNLLDSLERQTVRPGRILVVDDDSADDTALVADRPGVEVVTSRALPAGWTGKSWACHQGAAAGGGSVLAFLDADVTLAPDALAAGLATHQRLGGLVSVQPHHHVERPYERLSAVFNLVGVMGVGMASPRRPRTTAAFGPYLLTSRADYQRVGGHAGVAHEVIEDVALGRRYAAVGLPVRAFGGGGLVSFRMYPEGFRQLLEGWSKNFSSGAGATPPLRLAMIVLWVTAVLISIRFAIEAAVGPSSAVALGVAAYLLVALQVRWMLRQVGTFGWVTALTYPVAFSGFVLVFARSAWLSLVRREVRWRGRPIAVGHRAGQAVGKGSGASDA